MTPLGSPNRGCGYPSKERLSYLVESPRVHARQNTSFQFQPGLAQELGVMAPLLVSYKHSSLTHEVRVS
jgi:hypothetical protein